MSKIMASTTQCRAAQFYADTTDFTGLPDPSLNNTVAPATAGESDGDQFVALNQRTSFEPLFAKYGVDVSLPLCLHLCLSCTCVCKYMLGYMAPSSSASPSRPCLPGLELA